MAVILAAWLWVYVQGQQATETSTSEAPVSIISPEPSSQHGRSVTRGEPLWLTIPGLLGKTALFPGGVSSDGGKVVPVNDRPVFWKDSNLPGTDSLGTAVILGHNYATSGSPPPFSVLGNLEVGALIQVGVPAGILQYQVVQKVTPPKRDFANPAELQGLKDPVPGRLLLITCDTENGRDTIYNLVVVAQLSM